MNRYWAPGLALVLGLTAFLWLELTVLPQIAHLQARDPREAHLIAELDAGRIGGPKGPALAEIIKNYGLQLGASYQMQVVLAKLSRYLALVLFVTGIVDLYNIIWLRRRVHISKPG